MYWATGSTRSICLFPSWRRSARWRTLPSPASAAGWVCRATTPLSWNWRGLLWTAALPRTPALSISSDGFAALCKQVLGDNISALEQTFQLVDREALRQAVDLLEQARRVACIGQGGSMVLAMEAWTLFSMVSSKFIYVPDSHLQINTLAGMEPDEAVLYFSYSGSTRDLQDALEVARTRQVPVILVSRFPKSPGGQQANVVLQCGVNESPLQPGSVSARMAQLLILDLLFQQLCSRNRDQVDERRSRIAEAAAKKHL